MFQILCDQLLVDPNLKNFKLISNNNDGDKTREISYLNRSQTLHIVYNLKEMFEFMDALSFKIQSQQNILIIIQDFYFDLIDYVYIDGNGK